jgi:putative transposase
MLGINRTSVYYEPKQRTAEEKELEELIKSRIDYWHIKFCYMGVRRIKAKLEKEDGIKAGRKLIRRYMGEMNIYTVYPKPNLSKRNKKHKVFPYLLKNMNIFMPNQVWAVDITYIKMGKSHMYLTAVIDWYSRLIVGWELSDTLDTAPVLDAMKDAVSTYGAPGIINSDQGSNFTSAEFTGHLKELKIRQSMDGKARWVDNVIIERWFRSLKTECVYINEYKTPKELRRGIRDYIVEYNEERPHQSLANNYPANVFAEKFAA